MWGGRVPPVPPARYAHASTSEKVHNEYFSFKHAAEVLMKQIYVISFKNISWTIFFSGLICFLPLIKIL